jgi:hypothetical protein
VYICFPFGDCEKTNEAVHSPPLHIVMLNKLRKLGLNLIPYDGVGFPGLSFTVVWKRARDIYWVTVPSPTTNGQRPMPEQ